MKTGTFMKAGTFVILGVALITGGISVRADDTADQAAARAALEQILYRLDHPGPQPPADTNSAAPMAQPAESTAHVTNAASTTAAPDAKAPVAVAPAQGASVATAPADGDFARKIPVADTTAQAVAVTALMQKMGELNAAEAQPPPVANSATTMAVTPVAAPAHEPSAAAVPVTETPAAEAPVAVTPAMAPAAVAPVSSAPAVVAPVPKVSTATAAAASVVDIPRAAQAPATRQLPSGSLGQARPANELVTTTGVIYRNVEVQKVLADAIVISYTPGHGGWAMTKVYFRDLPPEIRQQYEKP